MRTFVLCLLLAGVVTASPPVPKRAVPLKVDGDLAVVVKSFPIRVTATIGDPTKCVYIWNYPAGVEADIRPATYTASAVLTVTKAPKGSFLITVSTLEKGTFAIDNGETTLVVGELPPAPGPGPTPPGPGPGPKPPEPTPPVPDGPMRVLIVFESKDLVKKASDTQRTEIIRSLKFQNLLKDRTDKNGPNGRGWNIWEQDQQGVELMDKFWQDAFKRPRTTTPFIHIFKGDKIVHEGPLPATGAEAVELINKYAGS